MADERTGPSRRKTICARGGEEMTRQIWSDGEAYNPTEAHRSLRESVARFSKDNILPQADANDATETFNVDLFRRFATELGLFGVTVPEAYGGLGLDATAAVIIHEEMSRHDPALTMSYLAHEELFVNNFFHSATEEQREKYLPKVLDGTWIGAMGMSEPGAGTDVLGLITTARRDGNGYILNGTKQWITNATHADVFLIYARIEGQSRQAISAFVVEKGFEGFSIGRKETKMGMRQSPTAQLIFDNVRVPAENLLGGEGGALVNMMRNLEIERLTLAAQSLGIAMECTEIMANYAINDRKAFGQPLSAFGQIQRFLGEAYSKTEAARALVYQCARATSATQRNSLGAAAAKLMATTMAEEVARNAIQTLGGNGYTRDYHVERLYRDAILLSIGGGTNEAMQKNMTGDIARLIRR